MDVQHNLPGSLVHTRVTWSEGRWTVEFSTNGVTPRHTVTLTGSLGQSMSGVFQAAAVDFVRLLQGYEEHET